MKFKIYTMDFKQQRCCWLVHHFWVIHLHIHKTNPMKTSSNSLSTVIFTGELSIKYQFQQHWQTCFRIKATLAIFQSLENINFVKYLSFHLIHGITYGYPRSLFSGKCEWPATQFLGQTSKFLIILLANLASV